MPLLGTLALLPLSLSDCLTQTYSLLVPELLLLLLLLLSIQMESKHLHHFFFTDFYTKENADFRQLSISLGLSQKTHLHSSTLLVPAWLLLLLSTQMESEDLHHCFCKNFYSKEIADFHQPQIRELSPLTRHSP